MTDNTLKELLELLGKTGADVKVVDITADKKNNRLMDALRNLRGPKGADEIASNIASYNGEIDKAHQRGDMSAQTADWYRGMQHWMDNESSDEQKFTLVQLKEMGFGAFASLWLVRERGFNADKACLLKYSMKLAFEPVMRNTANDMMHAAEDHGLGLAAAQLALDFDAHQTKAEAWIVELSTACVARIGEYLGSFPNVTMLDLEDSREATERLYTTYKEIAAKEAGQIQEG